MAKVTMSWPTGRELVELLPRALVTQPPDRDAALTLYYFLPVELRGIAFRSSLEALLGDARGASGRDPETGRVLNAAPSNSWLGAVGYLCLVDQVSKLLDVPPAPGGDKPSRFERLLIWDGSVLSDEAAAIYALRCAFVHSYGLSNDPRRRGRTAAKPADRARERALLHMFELTADGRDLVKLGPRNFSDDAALADIAPTAIDIRAFAEVAETLVRDLREAHLAKRGLTIHPQISAAEFVRSCLFQFASQEAVAFEPAAGSASVPYSAYLDSASPPVTGWYPSECDDS